MAVELAPAILAITLIVLGGSFLLQTLLWMRLLRSIFEQPERYFFGATAEVLIGLTLALSYDRWDSTWPIFTTVFGWLMALEGTFFLLAPGLFRGFNRLSERAVSIYLRGGGVILLLLGGSLARFAFAR
ncbi:MAG: hypothetical protein SH820_16245 [Xanthomonadales bacterium]|nr:hypothetical protein [Xanthomonadales bacterium]